MRRIITAGTLALFAALFTGCDQTETPTEPSFAKGGNKVTYECTDPVVLAQKADLEGTIEYQLENVKSQKGALNNVDNMARNIGKDPPDLAAARYTYFEFEIEINKQNVEKIVDGEAGRQLILVQGPRLRLWHSL